MESNLPNALLLMVTGMSTVFFILFLVISGGNLLIKAVNKVNLPVHEVSFTKINNENISPSREAIIKAAIEIITQGKGKVDRIDKR
ncbi:MAG: OadG family protein [Saprospiraceae bacterium]|nr:OadG family protein [Saprospiraceae bacterium]MBP6567839.1 OadG family protein [Saprospiraceae bacterium]